MIRNGPIGCEWDDAYGIDVAKYQKNGEWHEHCKSVRVKEQYDYFGVNIATGEIFALDQRRPKALKLIFDVMDAHSEIAALAARQNLTVDSIDQLTADIWQLAGLDRKGHVHLWRIRIADHTAQIAIACEVTDNRALPDTGCPPCAYSPPYSAP